MSAFIVVAGITAVWFFIRFVYRYHTASALTRQAEAAELKRQAEDYPERRQTPKAPPQLPPLPTLSPFSVSLSLSNRSTPPRSPTPQAPSHHVHHPATASSSATHGTTTDENGDEESALLLDVKGSTTAREDPNVKENATLRKRLVPIHEHSTPLLVAPSATVPNVNEQVNTTLPSKPVAFDNNSNDNPLFGSAHHQGTAVPTQDSRLRLEPTVTVPPSPSSSGVSRSSVDEWRRTVTSGLHEEHGQAIRSVVDRRPLPSSSTVPVIPVIPSFVPPPAVSDESNADTLPQTPIYPTHDSSVPSTPSSTMSGTRSVVLSPSPQVPPLSTSTTMTSTNVGATGASGTTGTNASETSALDPWNGALATQDGEHDVSASVSSAAQANAASFQSDGSGDSSSTSQLKPPNASGVSPQLTPFSLLSSMLASTESTHCNQPMSFKLPQPSIPQSSPPQTPPYLLTSSAQHPHHLYYSSPSNTALASSPTNTTTASAIVPPAAIAPTLSRPTKSSPPASPILSLSQDQGIEIVSNPTCSFRSSSFSDPLDLVVPESPGPFGSPGSTSLQSPFIPLSTPFPPLPVPPGACGNGTGGDQQLQQRKPLSLLGSASSVMATTTRQSSSLNPPPPSNVISMFYSLTDGGSTTTTTSRQTSPTSLPAHLPPPAVQPDGVLLSFPAGFNYQQQQHIFASPGIMSPVLSELDFLSEFGSSELGPSDDDIGSESSLSSDSCRDTPT